MKNILNKIAILTLLITAISCQEVVDVDLETTQERIVIEALLKWEQGTTGNEQIVKLSKTSSFYNNQPIYVNNASVIVKKLNTQQEFNFLLLEDGVYQTSNFTPEINSEYELTVMYNNETYKSTTTLLASPTISNVTQSLEEGFSLEEPEVNFIFQDFQNQEDFYRISLELNRPGENEAIEDFYHVFNDSFQENNVINIFYENDDFLPGDIITGSLYKISEPFFNYLNKLGLQEESGVGPFSSPPINVKGNIVNTNNEENYPYGYFSINHTDTVDYVFE